MRKRGQFLRFAERFTLPRLIGFASCRVLFLLLVCAAGGIAQDGFEIQIYRYESVTPGRFSLEQHLNYNIIGTKEFDGEIAPSNNQFHMTYELTGGIHPNISLGVMVLSAVRPGGPGLEYAGWRLLPHFYVPKSWRLPVDLGLVAELSFQGIPYEENSRRIELRPIVEKRLGHFVLTANPAFERAFRGPGSHKGWSFNPGGRASYEKFQRFSPNIEYYSGWGPVTGPLPLVQQIHQIFAGGDVRIRENLRWNFGVGAGATDAGNRLAVKSILQYEFGKKEEEH